MDLDSFIPDRFYQLRTSQTKPLGPRKTVHKLCFLQTLTVAVVFAVLTWYFYLLPVAPLSKISKVPDPKYNCETLIPKNGIAYLSDSSSENAQYQTASLKYDDCVSTLSALNPCATEVKSLVQIVAPTQSLGNGCILILQNGFLVCSPANLINTAVESTGALVFGQSSSLLRPDPPLTSDNALVYDSQSINFIGGLYNAKFTRLNGYSDSGRTIPVIPMISGNGVVIVNALQSETTVSANSVLFALVQMVWVDSPLSQFAILMSQQLNSVSNFSVNGIARYTDYNFASGTLFLSFTEYTNSTFCANLYIWVTKFNNPAESNKASTIAFSYPSLGYSIGQYCGGSPAQGIVMADKGDHLYMYCVPPVTKYDPAIYRPIVTFYLFQISNAQNIHDSALSVKQFYVPSFTRPGYLQGDNNLLGRVFGYDNINVKTSNSTYVCKINSFGTVFFGDTLTAFSDSEIYILLLDSDVACNKTDNFDQNLGASFPRQNFLIKIDTVATPLVSAMGCNLHFMAVIPQNYRAFYRKVNTTLLYFTTVGTADTIVYDTNPLISSSLVPQPYAVALYYSPVYYYGNCGKRQQTSFIDVTSTYDFSISCNETGSYYYQGPNVWYPVPSECISMNPATFVANCSDYAIKLKSTINSTCPASYAKMCKASYDDNPPFFCTAAAPIDVLGVISSSYAGAALAFTLMVGLTTAYFGIVNTFFQHEPAGLQEDDSARLKL